MKRPALILNCRGQQGIEYLLIVTVVAIIAIAAFGPNGLLRNVRASQSPDEGLDARTDGFFASVTRVIQGEKPKPIDGGWCRDAAGAPLTCECPSPAFGGHDC